MSNKDLSKMGAAKVSLVNHHGQPCIQKQGASAVEIHFYQHATDKLTGVNTPRLLDVCNDTLYIEQIPHQVTLADLLKNTNTFEQLASIHQTQYRPDFAVKTHRWQAEDTEKALRSLALSNQNANSIRTLQTMSGEIFEHDGLISGDSNEGNWGTRASGELVLFDWERFGLGSPAIDLAPLVHGLGQLTDYHAIASLYRQHNPLLSNDTLVRQLILAKGWLIVEVTNLLVSREKQEAKMYIDWYRKQIPNWLKEVEPVLS
ncbi:phosphotransferase family protein [Vibrio vulnificus]|uniref:phosphotransferase family protein n=1 Tax=Vibrio vulnificus TaxID=672 RepID=UPI00187D2604|nr:choline kinase [Vibrio vulnificus]